MLARAAQRAAKAGGAQSFIRGYAKPAKRFVPAGAKPQPTPSPAPSAAKPAPAPAPAVTNPSTATPKQPAPTATPRQPATGAARQTSPGTALPKNQTWKPRDSIKFAAPVGAAAATQARPAVDAAAPSQAPSVSDAVASQVAADGAANTQASPQVNTEPQTQLGPKPDTVESHPTESPEPDQPTGPLPDLRQGIPSTFDFEFADKPNTKNPTEQNLVRDENVEPGSEASSSASASGGGRRGGDDEQYKSEDYETSFDKRRAKMANYGYLSMLAFALTGSAYFARPYEQGEAPAGLSPDDVSSWSPTAMYTRVRSRMGSQVGYYTEPTFQKLLPDVPEAQRPPLTLVLSLEDLMIHSSWTREHGWRTAKRPGIDYFLKYLSQYYELVLFTSVPVQMADPVIKKLDPFHIIQWPLFREATKYENGQYVKDLSYLNRPLDKVIMIDTKAEHAKNNLDNAIILPKWKGAASDPHAKDLVSLIPFLEYVATMGIEDTRKVLASFSGTEIPKEFASREAKAREAFQKQLEDENNHRPKRSLGGLFNKALGIKGAPGGMTLDNETTVAEGLSQGKMLSDQIRERGQREYQRLEAEIQKNGEKWLKEMEEEEKKFMENMSKDMKKSWFGWGGAKPATPPTGSEVQN